MTFPELASLLDRLRRSPSEPVLKPLQALALALTGVALGLLTYGASWKIALLALFFTGVAFALFFTGVAFALFFRDLSGTPAGGDQSSRELARRALKMVALTLVLMALIVIAIYLAS